MLTQTQRSLIEENAFTLSHEIAWLKEVLTHRLAPYARTKSSYVSINQIPSPDLSGSESPYAVLIKKEKLSKKERLIVLLALIPVLEPQALDVFFSINTAINKTFTEFGGKPGNYSGFIPTIETVMFLLGGDKLSNRMEAAEIFSPQSNYPVRKMLEIRRGKEGEPFFSSLLALKNNYYSLLVEGRPYFPRFSSEFPAERLTTKLDWSDLLLNHQTSYEVEEILNWLQYNHEIKEDWKFSKRLKKGYRALFYGPSGTGKTLTASLLGKKMDKEVYRVDLSQVISKYIGETEKNLANIFDQAEDKDWILFFDEADALFGKRVNATSSNDQHSNQQVAYLLQRIENYPGVIILATNFRSNMDKAFTRRFQSIIHFNNPNFETRQKLWKAALPKEVPLAEDLDITEISKKYKATGGMIVNIIHYTLLTIFANGEKKITKAHLIEGIRKELAKEGK